MTYTLVHANTVITTTSATTLTPTCTSTTAHNLLVAVLTIYSGSAQTIGFTGGGWTQAVQFTDAGPSTNSSIWYRADCPAGITSQAITWTSAVAAAAQILEFAGGATTTPLDRTGTIGVASGGTSLAIATSATTTAANELAVAASAWDFASAVKVTLATGTGFTNAGSFGQGLKQNQHSKFDYKLDTGSAGVTPTDTVTDGAITGSDGCGGVIATFKLPGAAASFPQVPRVISQAVMRAANY